MTNNEIVALGLRDMGELKLVMLHNAVKSYKGDVVQFIQGSREVVKNALPDVPGVTKDQVMDALIALGDENIRKLLDAEVARRNPPKPKASGATAQRLRDAVQKIKAGRG